MRDQSPLNASISSSRFLGCFDLVALNVVAVASLRSLPMAAQYGWGLFLFYLIPAVFFLIPVALVTAELVTRWPVSGGVCVWVRMALGPKWSFLSAWLQWVYNVVWYPTILVFIVITACRWFNPSKSFILVGVLIVWWVVIGIAVSGLSVSRWVSNLGALLGTLIPLLIIIVLGLMKGLMDHTVLSHPYWPNFTNLNNLGFLTATLFSLTGLEMSAAYAGEVRRPSRDYPRALLWSVPLILASLLLGSLAIFIAIPSEHLNIISGIVDACAVFFTSYQVRSCMPLMIGLIVLGSFCSLSAWVLGPARTLLVALKENGPAGSGWLLKTNGSGTPVRFFCAKGILVTLLCGVYVLFPRVESAHWLLNVMTLQLEVIYYAIFFIAAWVLRQQTSSESNGFRIPGGAMGAWLVTGLGLAGCVVGFIAGFFPPPSLLDSSVWLFQMMLITGILLSILPPFVLKLPNKQSNQLHSDD